MRKKSVIGSLLFVVVLLICVFQTALVSHARDFRVHTLMIDMTAYKNRAYQLEFKNAEIVSGYMILDDGRTRSISIGNGYNNISQSENTIYAGTVVDRPIYVTVKTESYIENIEDVRYEIKTGTKENPFDYSKVDLSKGNTIGVGKITNGENIYTKVYLKENEEYFIEGQTHGLQVEDEDGEIIFKRNSNENTRFLGVIFKAKRDGFHYIVATPSNTGHNIKRISMGQIGVKNFSLKPKGLYESYSKVFIIDTRNNYGIVSSIQAIHEYESLTYRNTDRVIKEYFGESDEILDRESYGSFFNPSKTVNSSSAYYFNLLKNSKVLTIPYGAKLSIFDEVPDNTMLLNVIKNENPKVGTNAKEEVQELKVDDREASEIGDPVDAFRGNFVDRKTLLSYSGDNALSFDINYDSIGNDSFSLASGFTHNFETKLIKSDEEIALYWNPNAITRFKKEDGAWKNTREKDSFVIEESINGYRVVDRENVYEFDFSGKLLRQHNSVGHHLDYFYSENGTLIEVRNHRKQSFYFEYAGDRLIKLSDIAGRTISFVYDSTKTQLNKIIYPNAKELVFTYQADTKTSSSPAKLKTMTFAGKLLVDNVYNSLGAVISQKDGNGNQTSFLYNEWSNPETITTRMIQPNGTAIYKTHNQFGQVVREENERGFERTFEYDSKGNKIKESDYKGNIIHYEYDENGNVIKVTYPDETIIHYEYNDAGLITRMIDKDGSPISYSYNEKNQMISMTDKEGLVTNFEYDSMGNVVKQTVNNRVLEREYDESGNLVQIKLPDGKTSIHEYDNLGRQTATIVGDGTRIETIYDSQNNVLKQVNPDGTFVSYEYDAFGKKIKETDAMGRVTTFTYDNNGNLRTELKGLRGISYTYDKMNRVVSKSYKGVGGTYSYVYDEVGNVTQENNEDGTVTARTYDENNQVLTERKYTDTTSFKYDLMGRLIEKVDPLGNIYKYEYNPLGLLTKTISPSGYETQYKYDKMGRQIELIDPKGNVYQTSYNENGEKVEELNPLGEIVKYEYDNNGRLVSTINALNERNTFIYNNLGQIIEQRNARNEVVSQMKYDVSGRIIEMTDGNGNTNRMVYDAVGNLVESYNAENNLISKNEFNEFNELTKIVNALNSATYYEYNLRGFQTKMTDSLGNETIYSYTSTGKPYSTKDANGMTAYNYFDSKGRLTENNLSTFKNKYSYNANDQVLVETMPGGNTLTYRYNPESLLSHRINGRGSYSYYYYDENGNLIRESNEEGKVYHEYDELNRLIQSKSPSGMIERKYDALGRVIEKTQNGKTISYQYDDRGHLVSMTYPDGKEVHYTYDVMGNLLTVTDWKDNVTSYAYNKNNQLVKTTHSNGVLEEREYNVAGQLVSVKSYKNELLITHFTYEYDLNGNITKEVDVKTGKENVYTYDKLGRLTNANGNSYTYTPTGNISNYQITHNGQTINQTMSYNADNQLSKVGSDLTSIDKDGNLLTYKLNGKTYVATYDSQNKLVQYGNMYFQYDSEGNRIGVRETDGLGVTTKETSFVVDNDSNRLSRILVESSADGDIYYVYGHGLISEHKGDNVNTYHFDYRGSTVAMTDKNGDIIGEAEYDEYGVILKSTIVTRFMYNGQFGIENDGNGLYYMRTRYYNVDLKKFMNRDVVVGNIQESQTLNRYAYVNGNPVNFTDPFGMARETVENTQAQAKGIGGANMETLHFVLDMLGMFPVLGEFADAANVVLYMAEGNYKMAMLSAAAMVPIIGNLATGGKMVSKVVGKLDTAKDAVVKGATNTWGWLKKTGSSAGSQLSKGWGKVKGILKDEGGYIQPGAFFSSSSKKNVVKEVDIYYKTYKKNIPEFERQLKGQEDGINELSAGEIRSNIKKFETDKRKGAQSAINKVRNNTPGLTYDDAVLHNPDMIIGGYSDRNLTVGDRNVNSSLGSQNRYRKKHILKALENVNDDDYVKFNFKHK